MYICILVDVCATTFSSVCLNVGIIVVVYTVRRLLLASSCTFLAICMVKVAKEEDARPLPLALYAKSAFNFPAAAS